MIPSTIDRPFAVPLSENEVQRAVFQHLTRRGARGVFAFHPKNGGVHQRGKRAGINKGLGVIPGVPDIIAIKYGKAYALELKSDAGKVSPIQVETMQAMQAAGTTVAVAYGLSDALAKLEGWGLLQGRAG